MIPQKGWKLIPLLWLPANYVFIIRMNSDYASQVQAVKRLHSSEILCLRIKDTNFLSQILKLSRKEVLEDQICKNLLS